MPAERADDAQPVTLLPDVPPTFTPEFVALDDLPMDEEIVGPAPDPALVASVRRHGIFQPILLVQDGNGRLSVAEGRRRIKAARQAGLTAIPALITDGEAMLAAAVGLVTHGTRRDNPAADLEAIERLLAHGATEPMIARETGLRLQTVRQRMRLQRLDGSLRAALRAGHLAVGTAEQAARLPVPAQRRLAARLSDDGKLTGADVHAERQARADTSVATLPFSRLTATPDVHDERDAERSPSSPVDQVIVLLEATLQRLDGPVIHEVIRVGDSTLLVHFADAAACTIQVSAGVPSFGDAS